MKITKLNILDVIILYWKIYFSESSPELVFILQNFPIIEKAAHD